MFLKKKIRTLLNEKHGFTYTELILGITMLLISFSTFVSMYRYSNIIKQTATQTSTAATIAQTIADIYSSTLSTSQALETLSSYSGYTASIDVSSGSYISSVTITVSSTRIDDYTLIVKVQN